MLTHPNRYTLSEDGVTYGLHTFKDGPNPTVICQLHASGEWIVLAPPTAKQIEYFTAHGTKSEPVVVEKKQGKLAAEPEPAAE